MNAVWGSVNEVGIYDHFMLFIKMIKIRMHNRNKTIGEWSNQNGTNICNLIQKDMIAIKKRKYKERTYIQVHLVVLYWAKEKTYGLAMILQHPTAARLLDIHLFELVKKLLS